MAHHFAVRGDHIQLGQLLKASGLADSGGAAHAAIGDGHTRVDGEVDTRKRAKRGRGSGWSLRGKWLS